MVWAVKNHNTIVPPCLTKKTAPIIAVSLYLDRVQGAVDRRQFLLL